MIEFSNVSKVYPNGVVGLDDVNLTIEQGEFVGIIGLSGAGKSTLLRTINRMHDRRLRTSKENNCGNSAAISE